MCYCIVCPFWLTEDVKHMEMFSISLVFAGLKYTFSNTKYLKWSPPAVAQLSAWHVRNACTRPNIPSCPAHDMDFILQLSSGNSSSVAYKWLLPHPKTFTYFRSTECTVHSMSPLCLTRPCGTVGLSIFINGKWSAQRSMVMERSQSMLLHALIKCWNQCPETNIMGFNMLCDFANLSHINLASYVKELTYHTHDFYQSMILIS